MKISKELMVLNPDERKFKGILSVEIVDKQNEIIPIEEMEKVMDTIMKRGGFIIDSHCYSDDTRILTNDGLKYFDELSKEDKIATLNSETEELEYEFPTDYQKFKYNGKIVYARCNDRGPYIDGREFDLSNMTAKLLGFSGVHEIKYRIVFYPSMEENE